MFRRIDGEPEVFLVHPGGPFFKNKDTGAWTIPKGLVETASTTLEPLLETARREFEEETGFPVQQPLYDLGSIRMKGGKTVYAWAFEADVDPARLRSNKFPLEWPPQSGQIIEFPEADRGGYFTIPEAREKIVPAQAPFLDRLLEEI